MKDKELKLEETEVSNTLRWSYQVHFIFCFPKRTQGVCVFFF
jgi:hypothetical protein